MCFSHVNLQTFTSKYTDHGLKSEPEARQAFIQKTGKKVIEVGLVVSQKNPWLAVSPDGVIFENEVPVEVLEIKCPISGKVLTAKSAMDKSCKQLGLRKIEDQYFFNPKSKYYGQVQVSGG